MHELKLLLTGGSGTQDATVLMRSCTWAGGYAQVARTLDVSLVVSVLDKRLPVAECGLGSGVQFFRDGALLFDGFVFSRQKDTGSDTVDIGCFDRGIYLKRNEAAYLFKKRTPESITQTVCADFGISTGELAETGVPVTRSFSGGSLYQIIQTAYTLAAEQTGERYLLRFRGDKLEVIVKKQGANAPFIQAGSNLINATVTESTDNMVNQVAIYDDKGKLVGTQSDEEAVGLYGLMQAYLKKSKDQDPVAEAKKLLADGGVSQKITVENLGNDTLITGNSVVLREPVTGLFGLFWIDADTHTWKNGLYQNKLTLNFRNLMDEQGAGSQPK